MVYLPLQSLFGAKPLQHQHHLHQWLVWKVDGTEVPGALAHWLEYYSFQLDKRLLTGCRPDKLSTLSRKLVKGPTRVRYNPHRTFCRNQTCLKIGATRACQRVQENLELLACRGKMSPWPTSRPRQLTMAFANSHFFKDILIARPECARQSNSDVSHLTWFCQVSLYTMMSSMYVCSSVSRITKTSELDSFMGTTFPSLSTDWGGGSVPQDHSGGGSDIRSTTATGMLGSHS